MSMRAIALAALVGVSLSAALPTAAAEKLTQDRNSIQLFKSGDLINASQEERDLIARNPRDWAPRALLSFYVWQQGSIIEAIAAGERAIRLAPSNDAITLNLARMYEATDGCKKSAKMYRRTISINQANIDAYLGLARCQNKIGLVYDALDILENVVAQDGKQFNWYRSAASSCLDLEAFPLAANAARKAASAARSAAETSQANALLLMALLRGNEIESAKQLVPKIFPSTEHKDYELYARTAETLISAQSPELGAMLASSAEKNLKTAEGAEGLYRLGRIFEEKSRFTVPGSSTQLQWLTHAEKMYALAAATDPYQARYQFSYAGVLFKLNKNNDAQQRLRLTSTLDGADQLAKFLNADESKPTQAAPQLSKVDFVVTGLTCSCHVSFLETAFSKVPGVQFATVARTAPYVGTMMIDQTTTDPTKALAECKSFIESSLKLKEPVKITFEIKTVRNLNSKGDAIKTAQDARLGSALQFFHFVATPQPTAPWLDAPMKAASLR